MSNSTAYYGGWRCSKCGEFIPNGAMHTTHPETFSIGASLQNIDDDTQHDGATAERARLENRCKAAELLLDLRGEQVAEKDAIIAGLEAELAQLRKRLEVACHIKADDPAGFDYAVLDRIGELEAERDEWRARYEEFRLGAKRHIDGLVALLIKTDTQSSFSGSGRKKEANNT